MFYNMMRVYKYSNDTCLKLSHLILIIVSFIKKKKKKIYKFLSVRQGREVNDHRW
jgi:hypothetical protein